jgi:hypothetical protein
MPVKSLLITIALCWVFFQLTALIWSSKGQAPTETLARLLEPPMHHIPDPRRNGYFYLLGLTVAPSLDPAWVGYDIWHEADAKPITSTFDYDQPGRSDFRLAVVASFLSPVWNADDPFGEIRQRESALRAAVNQYNLLLTRYDHWLGMKFDDQGFAHRAVPRFGEILLVHRLYLADGFSQRLTLGMNRLQKDMIAWRLILREARTLSTKVMAQVVIADDLKLLSKLFARPTIDKALVPIGISLTTPLTHSEYSLGWPIKHQLTLGVQGDRLSGLTGVVNDATDDANEQWLIDAAALSQQAFRRVKHPAPRSFLGVPLQTQRTWDTYASYYDVIMTASEAGHGSLPTFREVTQSTNGGLLGYVFNSAPFEPDWNPFHHQLRETDARLRLASLQIVLRRPSPQTTVPNRLAEIGPNYFDPFSGLPMLWSPTQKKIYSVGKDRFDDGGDSDFDISVPAVVSNAATDTKEPARSATAHRTRS